MKLLNTVSQSECRHFFGTVSRVLIESNAFLYGSSQNAGPGPGSGPGSEPGSGCLFFFPFSFSLFSCTVVFE